MEKGNTLQGLHVVSILTVIFFILMLCGTASAGQLYVNETGWWPAGGIELNVSSNYSYTNWSTTYHNENKLDNQFISKSVATHQINKSNLTDAQKKFSTNLLRLINDKYLNEGQNKETLEMQMTKLRQYRSASSISLANGNQITDDLVYVYIYLKPSAETQAVDSYVWEITDRDEKNHFVVAWVGVNDLEKLASLETVRTIREVLPPHVNKGSVTTEGDTIHRTSHVRNNYSQSGAGVKVGVISNGVNNFASAISSGDLPADLVVLSNTIGGDEGTAMLEIIHDMVPDAKLYFHDSGSNTDAFNAAVDALVNAGCTVIVDDISWIREPFFEDGTVASHISTVLSSHDVVYISSAGNAAQNHYQGVYVNDGFNFHNDPININILPYNEVRIVLEWNDKFGLSGNDYDLYLSDTNGYILDSNEYPQDGDDDPLEFITYTNTGDSTITAQIVIYDYSSTEAKTLELYIYGASISSNNIVTTDSIFGHPAVPDIIAVGAVDASDPGNDDIELFSSQGPVTIAFPSSVTRSKPDLIGIDGVTVTGAGGFSNPFYGTSAAAPHVAAIAAQLWGAAPTKTAGEIRDILYSSAIDLGDPGYDYVYGYGRADMLNAYGEIAHPPLASGQLYVNETGWWHAGGDFNSSDTPIQFAINNANADDSIYVYNGSYNENVDVNKSLTLEGEGTDVVNVTAASPADHVFNVIANNVTISGFNVSGATGDNKAGIYVTADNCNISNNIATNNDRGIFLHSSNNNNLTSNIANSNNYCGIALFESSNHNTLTSNTANSNNYYGIVLYESNNNNTLTSNTANSNSVDGIVLYESNNNNLTSNTADLNSEVGIFIESSSNNILTDNIADSNSVYGIDLQFSSNNNTLTSNTANSNSVDGIVLYESSNNNTLTSNTANSNNDSGIWLKSSSDNTLINNTAGLNNGGGIFLLESSNNTLTSNTVNSNNVHGIALQFSSNNTLTSNTLSGNNWDIWIEDSSSDFTNNTLNSTTVSFTYGGNVSLKGTSVAPVGDPSGWSNMSRFINATNQSVRAWMTLNFSYSDPDLSGLNESSLKVWKYNGTAWVEDGWNGTRYLDAANNVVGVNITSFSVFAPMAQPILDTTSPIVVDTSSENLATDVKIDSSITTTFSEPMNSSTLNDTTVKVYKLATDKVTSETFENVNGAWNSSNFQGFSHAEELKIEQAPINDTHRTIVEGNLTYSTRPVLRYYQVYIGEGIEVMGSRNYSVISWLGDEYIAVNGKPDKLTNLVFEQKTADTKTLQIGETWDLGDGYSLKLLQIDVDNTKAWIELYNSSGFIDDEILDISPNEYAIWELDLNIANEPNVPFFVTYLNKVTSTTIELKYTWLISQDATVIESDNSLGVFEVTSISSDAIRLANKENVSLTRGSTIPLVNDLMFEVEDNSTVRYRFVGTSEIKTALEGDISYDSASRTVTFDPISNLMYGTTYISHIISGVEDLVGNGLIKDYEWEFNTISYTPPYTPPPSGGGGGGGGGGSSGEEYENIEFKDAARVYTSTNANISFTFDKAGNEIQYINYKALTSQGYISATIEVLKDTSALAKEEAPGIICKNINIWVGKSGYATDDNIENPVIGFKVEKKWIQDNDIEVSSIKLNRYHGDTWTALPTEKTDEDTLYVHFESQTPGFSPFAITGQKKALVTPSEPRALMSPPEPTPTVTTPTEVETPPEPASWGSYLLLGVVALVAITGAYMYMQKRQG